MSLDSPIYELKKNNWLPSTTEHDKITLHHILTHTSGLSNFLGDKKRELKFSPGSEFAYSGIGFMYLQEILTKLSGETIDEFCADQVFETYQMTQSRFGSLDSDNPKTASGHISLMYAVIPFSIVYLPAFAILFLIMFLMGKFILKKWNPTLAAFITLLLSSVIAVTFLYTKSGSLEPALYFTASSLLFNLTFLLLSFLFVKWLKRLLKLQYHLIFDWIFAIIVSFLILYILKEKQIPVADWSPKEGNAASSFKTTSSDLAQFMNHFMNSHRSDSSLISKMTTPQVNISNVQSWGLGIAIKTNENRKIAWHKGSNPGSQSVMIMDLKNRIGLVVLTNSGNGDKVIDEIVRKIFDESEWDF